MDYLRLNENKLFESLRETLPKNCNKTQNVLTLKDDTLFTWDFQSNCVLTLNVKSARRRQGDNVKHQTLLPTYPPIFTPDTIKINDNGTMLTIYGPNGILVIVLPSKCPPYGAFSDNKEIIYCKSISILERDLAFHTDVEIRQARFHPGDLKGTTLIVLTSDNKIRVFNLENNTENLIGSYSIGQIPMGKFPGTKTTYLEALGETVIDFDFAPPEYKDKKKLNNESSIFPEDTKNRTISMRYLSLEEKFDLSKNKFANSPLKRDENKNKFLQLKWPILLLYGNGDIYNIVLDIDEKCIPEFRGPMSVQPQEYPNYGKNACALICIHSTPPVVSIANSNGNIYHALLLPVTDEENLNEIAEGFPKHLQSPEKCLYIFECVELELGLTTTSKQTTSDYCCPIFLHKNLGNICNYFATHEAGLHSILINSLEEIHKFVNSKDDEDDYDVFKQSSTADYLICTSTSSTKKSNPVIGFTLYQDPTCIVTLLGNGQLVSLAIMTMSMIPTIEDMDDEDVEQINSPLKKMLANPFDVRIQKILKKAISHPIFKFSLNEDFTQKELFELFKVSELTLREETFVSYNEAINEIEKRVKALKLVKNHQINELDKLSQDKRRLQDKAENLAEKYEDIKDKQEELTKRCEKLLMMISKKQTELTNAEKDYLKDISNGNDKIVKFSKAISNLKNKIKYQEIQMANWNSKNTKIDNLGAEQYNIKTNLQDTTNKITEMTKEIIEYKKKLNIQ